MTNPKLDYTLEIKTKFGDRIARVANEVATIFVEKKIRNADDQYETQIDITEFYQEFEDEMSTNEFARQVGIQLLEPITFKSQKSWFCFIIFSFCSFKKNDTNLILKLGTADRGTYFYNIWNGSSTNVRPLLDLIKQKGEIESYLYLYEKYKNMNQNTIIDKILSFLENENRIIKQNS